MTQRVARLVALWGSAGCTAESYAGPVVCHTRREMAKWIRETAESYGLTGRALRQIHIPRIWRAVQTRGSERVAFSISDTNPGSLYTLEFRGVSEAEANEWGEDS